MSDKPSVLILGKWLASPGDQRRKSHLLQLGLTNSLGPFALSSSSCRRSPECCLKTPYKSFDP